MKKYLKNVYDAGTIAFHYTILYSLYSGIDQRICKLLLPRTTWIKGYLTMEKRGREPGAVRLIFMSSSALKSFKRKRL